jgi:two-component system, NarL family, invasion response regulator UvrY
MGSAIKFAVAEDHEIVRKGIIDMILSFGGFQLFIEAADGQDLFNKISEAGKLPDILVMDISMPNWDGYETLDALRKKWPELKVLILTMHKHELAIIKMFRSGANGYMLKNSSPKELKNAIESILKTGFYFSELASSNLYNRLLHSKSVPTLTQKEIELLKLCHTDLTYKEIADKMDLSERSIAGYRASLFDKLQVNSRAGLVICGIQMGLIPAE